MLDQPTLTAVDVGNAGLKLFNGGAARFEPASVRTVADTGFDLSTKKTKSVNPIIYRSGPAALDTKTGRGIDSAPRIIGADVDLFGGREQTTKGTASQRIHTAAYLLLNLYGILASFPRAAANTRIVVDFVGGLPTDDTKTADIAQTLRKYLVGDHSIQWGEYTYNLTIASATFYPQPVAGTVSQMFTSDGSPIRAQLSKLFYGLDIGGGTTDATGREGVKAIPDSEWSAAIGMWHVAVRAAELINLEYKTNAATGQKLLDLLRKKKTALMISGDPIDVSNQINAASLETADLVASSVSQRWDSDQVNQGQLVIFGGGGDQLFPYLKPRLDWINKISLLPDPLFAVLHGLRALGNAQKKRQK